MIHPISPLVNKPATLRIKCISPDQPSGDMVETTNNSNITVEKKPLHTIGNAEAGKKRGKVFMLPPAAGKQRYDHQPATSIIDDVVGNSGGSSSSTPTADDFANLLFYESPEEDDEDISCSKSTKRRRISTIGSDQLPSPIRIKKKKNKRRRRRISFGASIPTIHHLPDVPTVHDMTSTERSTLWYSRSDLEDLKSCAQSSVQDIRKLVLSNDKNDVNVYKDRTKFRALMSSFEEDTNCSIRGLEHRVFRRKQTRQMTIRDVLDCQAHVDGLAKYGHLMDDTEKIMLLAKVSKERSIKARNLAFVDAKDDYEEVYCDAKCEEVAFSR